MKKKKAQDEKKEWPGILGEESKNVLWGGNMGKKKKKVGGRSNKIPKREKKVWLRLGQRKREICSKVHGDPASAAV